MDIYALRLSGAVFGVNRRPKGSSKQQRRIDPTNKKTLPKFGWISWVCVMQYIQDPCPIPARTVDLTQPAVKRFGTHQIVMPVPDAVVSQVSPGDAIRYDSQFLAMPAGVGLGALEGSVPTQCIKPVNIL